jgi:hypothetical protein
MYIYSNSCGVNQECETGYSLYFPCINSITRGENSCSEFYIVDNATKEEVDLREIDDITLNISGRYNCNFGSYSYPENIKSSQVEKFSEFIYEIDFSNIINNVKLYIDIVDEKHNLIESYLFDENLILDIGIEGNIGYFLKGSEKYGILNLKGYDTYTYMFLGWNIEEFDGECDLENIYDYLIKNNKLTYSVSDDCVIRVVYQKRREYTIQMAKDNYNSSFIIEYAGKKTEIREYDSITVLEGHDIKVSCIPNDVKPYKFVKWDDGYMNPYRILNIVGDNLIVSLKANCELNDDYIEFDDNIDANVLNNFKTIYPEIRDSIFIEEYYIDKIYIRNCEIDILNDMPYIKIINDGYIQLLNIDDSGNLKISLNSKGGECRIFVDNTEILSSVIDENEFTFEFDGGILTLMGEDSCVFGLNIHKEVIYDKGKCLLCFYSENTLKFYPGDLVVDGGVIVNGNPYGIPPVKFATVTNITPLIIK